MNASKKGILYVQLRTEEDTFFWFIELIDID